MSEVCSVNNRYTQSKFMFEVIFAKQSLHSKQVYVWSYIRLTIVTLKASLCLKLYSVNNRYTQSKFMSEFIFGKQALHTKQVYVSYTQQHSFTLKVSLSLGLSLMLYIYVLRR